VANALQHFDEERYRLLAWVVMPNHAHTVLQPLAGFALEDLMHSIKSWTAKEANKLLGRSGEFWQAETYDHLVRDEDDLRHQVDYVWSNSDRAELENWRWRGIAEDAVVELIEGDASGVALGRDAQDTVGEESLPTPTDPAFA